MSDTNQAPRQTESEAHDSPRLSGKGFLLAVMHDPTVDIHDRIKAAASLLRIFGEHEFYPPRIKYIIGGIPQQALGPCYATPDPRTPIESTENHTHPPAQASILPWPTQRGRFLHPILFP